jgi:acyl transferase domain-containing protein/acyl carrier protein
MNEQDPTALDIAVIGMACEFPGARTPAEFWRNLRDGAEAVRFLTDEELRAKGVPEETFRDPAYVRAVSGVADIGAFDAEFFGISAAEATATDPQHRLFLECCWTALEDAGYDPETFDGDIGVFAGTGMNSYLIEAALNDPGYLRSAGAEQLMIGNDKDFLPSRVSYKLNLTGPSVSVNTACSTSLVAVHLGRQSLLLGESDIVLAGGVSLVAAGGRGYRYVPDGLQSPDGHCRAFDAKAEGTVWGDGCGVVVLKPLAAALADGDHVYATIKGSAVNNDGSLKVGYTAPSVEGQSRVIVEALADAAVAPDEIGYVEAHGTGTRLGDPIEVAALSRAFRTGTDRTGFCPIGSVKTNIGHLNAAAGIAGLIKTVLALRNGVLPPTLNFSSPNPEIDFSDGPFYVQTELSAWPDRPGPRRAGVSSMGIGGTNCHVILEEAPSIPSRSADEGEHVLVLSARSPEALRTAADALADHLAENTSVPLADVAFTLQCGRRHFRHRRAVVCCSADEAVRLLREPGGPAGDPDVVRWLAGDDVDWSARWADGAARRIPLPTYPFERRHFWYAEQRGDADDFTKLPDVADWFSVPVWKREPLPFEPPAPDRRTHLLFADDRGIGDALAAKLRAAGDTVAVVRPGGEFRTADDGSFLVNPAREADYLSLVRTLRDEDRLPDGTLFLWPLSSRRARPEEMDRESLVRAQDGSSLAILLFAQALDRLAVRRPMTFTGVTDDVFEVTGGEELNVHDSTVAGACLVIQQTYGHLASRVIDLSLPTGSAPGDVTDPLLAEITRPPSALICAYRNGRRHVRKYDRVRVDAAAPRPGAVQAGKNYLVYGGLEGIGHLIAEHIGRSGGTVLILEDAAFPDEPEWDAWLETHDADDPVGARIRRAQALIEEGAAFAGRLSTDDGDNTRLLADLEARSGPVAGVLHAPGSSNAKRIATLRSITPETWRGHFDAVAHSFLLLDRMVAGRELDFRIMSSSLGSVLGGDGFFQIATISGFAKAYAISRARTEHPWTVHCWDSWTVEWAGIIDRLPTALYRRVEPSVLTGEEGLACFERAFAVTGEVEVDISATNLGRRYEKWVTATATTRKPAAEPERGQHARPDLETAYVAPRTAMERDLADLFAGLLGVERIGVDDDFFSLGGHSLLGLQLISELRELRAIDIGLAHLYEMPTIARLASHLESLR